MIYADNAATSPLDPEIFPAMKEFLLHDFSNPSQPYSFSRKSRKAIADSRERIAHCINAQPDEIFFTSGGSESDNWAVKSSGRKRIITSAIEHKAVLKSCHTSSGNVIEIPVDSSCTVITSSLLDALNECGSPALVSVMLANNETGAIQPVKEIADISRRHGAIFHTDAVQALGHIPVDVKELGVDMLSGSSHKFNGPRGVGFLYVKRGISIRPFVDGGSQESGLRAGTENTAGIVGMSLALANNCRDIRRNQSHLLTLENILLDELRRNNIDFIRNGNKTLPGVLSLSFRNDDGERILHRLDLKGICISTGSACDGMNQNVSHVIRSMNIPPEYARGTVRISFGKYNTKDDAKIIADSLAKIIPIR